MKLTCILTVVLVWANVVAHHHHRHFNMPPFAKERQFNKMMSRNSTDMFQEHMKIFEKMMDHLKTDIQVEEPRIEVTSVELVVPEQPKVGGSLNFPLHLFTERFIFKFY